MRAFISRPRRGARRLLAIGGVVVAASALVFTQVGAAGAVDAPVPTPSASADAAPVAPEPSAGAVAPDSADATTAADTGTEEVVDPTDPGTPSETDGPTGTDEPAVALPKPVIHTRGGNCVADKFVPFELGFVWDAVPNQPLSVWYDIIKLPDGWSMPGGSTDPAAGGVEVAPNNPYEKNLAAGHYEISAKVRYWDGSWTEGDAATAEFTITECAPAPGSTAVEITQVDTAFWPDVTMPYDPNDPGKDLDSKEGVVHITVPVSFRNSAGERIDPPSGSEVTFVVTGEGAPDVLAPASAWNCLPGLGCLAYASFPATRTPDTRHLDIAAQVVIDGQPAGRSKYGSVILEGTEDHSTDWGGGSLYWQGGTVTATATCADAKTGTGEIAFTITQPKSWYYDISYDGQRIETPEQKSAPDPVTKWKAGFWPGGVTTRGIAADYKVPVAAGTHVIDVDGWWKEAQQSANLMKISVEVKPCETTGGGTGGNPTDGGGTGGGTGGNPTDGGGAGGGNTGGSTGGSTPSTTPAVKNGSPLTGTGAPGTGARGATAERANTIVAAGGIGTAALGLIAVAVLAYRRYRSA